MKTIIFNLLSLLLLSYNFCFADSINNNYNYYNADSVDYIRTQVKQNGLGIINQQIDYLTPLNYSGLGFVSRNNNFLKKRKFLYIENFKYSVNLLGNIDSKNSNIISADYLYDISCLYDLTKIINKSYQFYIGPAFSFNAEFAYKTNNSNNPIAYKYFANIDLTCMYRYEFGVKRKMAIQNNIYINTFSFGSTSGYTTLIPDGFDNNKFKSLLSFYGLNSHLLFRNIFSFDFQLLKTKPERTSSHWRISYYFEGEKLNNLNNWNKTSGSILVGRIIKLYNPR